MMEDAEFVNPGKVLGTFTRKECSDLGINRASKLVKHIREMDDVFECELRMEVHIIMGRFSSVSAAFETVELPKGWAAIEEVFES